MERTDIWPALDVKWGGKSRVKGFKGNFVESQRELEPENVSIAVTAELGFHTTRRYRA